MSLHAYKHFENSGFEAFVVSGTYVKSPNDDSSGMIRDALNAVREEGFHFLTLPQIAEEMIRAKSYPGGIELLTASAIIMDGDDAAVVHRPDILESMLEEIGSEAISQMPARLIDVRPSGDGTLRDLTIRPLPDIDPAIPLTHETFKRLAGSHARHVMGNRYPLDAESAISRYPVSVNIRELPSDYRPPIRSPGGLGGRIKRRIALSLHGDAGLRLADYAIQHPFVVAAFGDTKRAYEFFIQRPESTSLNYSLPADRLRSNIHCKLAFLTISGDGIGSYHPNHPLDKENKIYGLPVRKGDPALIPI